MLAQHENLSQAKRKREGKYVGAAGPDKMPIRECIWNRKEQAGEDGQLNLSFEPAALIAAFRRRYLQVAVQYPR